MMKILSDKIFKASSLLFACMMFGNVANFLYQAYMSRVLSTEEFGMLNALLSLGVIVSLPIQTLHTIVANVTSHLKAKEAYHYISRLFYKLLFRVSIVGTCGIVIFTLFSGYLQNFLKISSIYPLLIVGLLILLGFLLSVNLGILQGLQSFNYFGIFSGISGLLKLVFGALLVYLGLGVEGAIGGIVLGSFIVFLSSATILRLTLAKFKPPNPVKEEEVYVSGSFSYSVPVLIALLCFTSLTNIDLILVKHFFPPEEAGNYAVAAVLGKAILFLPAAIVLAMFPLVSESHALNTNSYIILKKSVVLAGTLSCLGLQAYLFFPELLVTILMGAKHASTAPLVRFYGLAMLPFAFINIFMYYNLATHEMKFLYTLVAGSLLEILLIYMYHDSLRQVIYLLIVVGCTLLIPNAWLIWADVPEDTSGGVYLRGGTELEEVTQKNSQPKDPVRNEF